MGRWLGVCALVFAVALAVVVGQRMSSEALAVVVGVVAGVAASLPTAVLVLVALSRREQKPQEAPPPPAFASPPVVVIQGGAQPSLPQPMWPTWNPPRERPFVVVGHEEGSQEESRSWRR